MFHISQPKFSCAWILDGYCVDEDGFANPDYPGVWQDTTHTHTQQVASFLELKQLPKINVPHKNGPVMIATYEQIIKLSFFFFNTMILWYLVTTLYMFY